MPPDGTGNILKKPPYRDALSPAVPTETGAPETPVVSDDQFDAFARGMSRDTANPLARNIDRITRGRNMRPGNPFTNGTPPADPVNVDDMIRGMQETHGSSFREEALRNLSPADRERLLAARQAILQDESDPDARHRVDLEKASLTPETSMVTGDPDEEDDDKRRHHFRFPFGGDDAAADAAAGSLLAFSFGRNFIGRVWRGMKAGARLGAKIARAAGDAVEEKLGLKRKEAKKLPEKLPARELPLDEHAPRFSAGEAKAAPREAEIAADAARALRAAKTTTALAGDAADIRTGLRVGRMAIGALKLVGIGAGITAGAVAGLTVGVGVSFAVTTVVVGVAASALVWGAIKATGIGAGHEEQAVKNTLYYTMTNEEGRADAAAGKLALQQGNLLAAGGNYAHAAWENTGAGGFVRGLEHVVAHPIQTAQSVADTGKWIYNNTRWMAGSALAFLKDPDAAFSTGATAIASLATEGLTVDGARRTAMRTIAEADHTGLRQRLAASDDVRHGISVLTHQAGFGTAPPMPMPTGRRPVVVTEELSHHS